MLLLKKEKKGLCLLKKNTNVQEANQIRISEITWIGYQEEKQILNMSIMFKLMEKYKKIPYKLFQKKKKKPINFHPLHFVHIELITFMFVKIKWYREKTKARELTWFNLITYIHSKKPQIPCYPELHITIILAYDI